MIKLHQQLESLLKLRINSNDEIIPYIKRLSEMGKFDEPKKVAVIALLLDRLGKLEDDAETERIVGFSGGLQAFGEPSKQLKKTEPSKASSYIDLNDVKIEPGKGSDFKCPDCDYISTSRIGLLGHSKKHNKVTSPA